MRRRRNPAYGCPVGRVRASDPAAIITPPDVVSQLALAVPMVLLYEIGILAAGFFIKHTKAPEDQAEEAAKP